MESPQYFFTAGPVREEEHFFGRAVETEEILGRLSRDQNVSVVGARKIGKSSLLHHISKPVVFEDHRMGRTRHRFVYIDCHELADLDASECRAAIVRQAKQEMPEVTFSLPPRAAEYFRRFFRQVERAGLRCIIMLDHFESFIHNRRLDQDCLENLRAMNGMYQVLYVISAVESLSGLEQRWFDQRNQTSPFFNIFHDQILEPFSQEESHAFLQCRFESASLCVPNSVADLILSWAQGRPFYLQSAGALVESLLNGSGGNWDEYLTERLQDRLTTFSEDTVLQHE